MKTTQHTKQDSSRTAQHTPGPWVLRNETRHEQETVIYKAGPSYSVYSNGHDGKGNGTVLWAQASEIESEANARLIAASPTMFDYIKSQAGKGDIYAAEIIKSIVQ